MPNGYTEKEYTEEEYAEYGSYRLFLKSPKGIGFPVPTSMEDYFANKQKYIEAARTLIAKQPQKRGEPSMVEEVTELAQIKPLGEAPWAGEEEWGVEEERAFLACMDLAKWREPGDWVPVDIEDFVANRYKAKKMMEIWLARRQEEIVVKGKVDYKRYQMFAKEFGDAEDWYPKDIEQFHENYEVALEQFEEWELEAARQFREYTDLSRLREPGDTLALNLDDFVANFAQAQGQEQAWLGRHYGKELAEMDARQLLKEQLRIRFKGDLTPEEEALSRAVQEVSRQRFGESLGEAKEAFFEQMPFPIRAASKIISPLAEVIREETGQGLASYVLGLQRPGLSSNYLSGEGGIGERFREHLSQIGQRIGNWSQGGIPQIPQWSLGDMNAYIGGYTQPLKESLNYREWMKQIFPDLER